jgi:hypothetical protein
MDGGEDYKGQSRGAAKTVFDSVRRKSTAFNGVITSGGRLAVEVVQRVLTGYR